MVTIRSTEDIHLRIRQIETQLEQIDKAIAKEFELAFFSRRKKVFQFLDLEKKIYNAILLELKWAIYE